MRTIEHRLPADYWRGRIGAIEADLDAVCASRSPTAYLDRAALVDYIDWLRGMRRKAEGRERTLVGEG